MKLTQPFIRLPVKFDAARLRAEVEALPAGGWAGHPTKFEGNSAMRLLSVDGGENDDFIGQMRATPHLQQCPYIRQVLASFGVVWSRSRLMRLGPRSSVPEHADINYQWFYRVRMHIPIITRPEVQFHCGGQSVHMAPGEAWIFDNWRLHRVENPTDDTRIHLVADTSGTGAFWEFVARAMSGSLTEGTLPFRPDADPALLTERVVMRPVMPPAEVELLMSDFRGELVAQDESTEAQAQLSRYHWLLQGFCFDWRQLHSIHGEHPRARPAYAEAVEKLRAASRTLSDRLSMRTNGIAAHTVLEGRLLRRLLQEAPPGRAGGASPAPARARPVRPVFIIAAPRSGSTLLFETLAASRQLWTLGDEAHWLIEDLPELRPGSPGVDSNRLTAEHCTPAIAARIRESLLASLRDAAGRPVTAEASEVRVLEKTPKNALRIPFLSEVFPDALFILLWRDPRENLSSIMEAWRSGRWTTYRSLPGREEPWSLLLPPGWETLAGRTLEEVAAFQWESANRVALGDLANLARDRWTAVSYGDLLADPRRVVRRLCGFAGIDFDDALAARVAAPLPLSRYTQTPPDPEKWRRNETEIMRVLPAVEATRLRLASL